MPASDDEIVELARTMWNEPALRAIFKRLGLHGDMTDGEQAAIDAAIDAYRQGPLWDRDQAHLLLAEGLLRRIVEGEFKDIADPSIPAFLERNRLDRLAGGLRPKPATRDEVMAFARALRDDPVIWPMLQEAQRDGVEFLSDKPERNYQSMLDDFCRRYRRKYSTMSRGSQIPVAISLVRGLADGVYPDVNSPEAQNYVEENLKRISRRRDG